MDATYRHARTEPSSAWARSLVRAVRRGFTAGECGLGLVGPAGLRGGAGDTAMIARLGEWLERAPDLAGAWLEHRAPRPMGMPRSAVRRVELWEGGPEDRSAAEAIGGAGGRHDFMLFGHTFEDGVRAFFVLRAEQDGHLYSGEEAMLFGALNQVLAADLERALRPRPRIDHWLHRHLLAMGRPPTSRQNEVLHGLLRGEEEDDIAARVGRSKHTVHDHIKRIYRVLGVRSRVELMLRLGVRAEALEEREPGDGSNPAVEVDVVIAPGVRR